MKTASKIAAILLTIVFAIVATSCSEDSEPRDENTSRTLIMYFPWSTDLTDFFITNIEEMEEAIKAERVKNQRVIVFFAGRNNMTAELFEIATAGGNKMFPHNDIERIPLKTYTDPAVTTAEGITGILNDIKAIAPAEEYSMIIGCHGLGWIPTDYYRTQMKAAPKKIKLHWEHSGTEPTRFFGGLSTNLQTDISTLADGITDAGIRMKYILFDDCYMANIETAYELRHVTDYLIASTSEIMGRGTPYATVGKYLLGEPDFEMICKKFNEFYSEYRMPYGSLSVTDCKETEKLADIMQQINRKYVFDYSQTEHIQDLDGYYPTIFFDMKSYVHRLCTDRQLLSEFDSQLQRTVVAATCTPTLYSGLTARPFAVNEYCGLTISDPSEHQMARYSKKSTQWYRASH